MYYKTIRNPKSKLMFIVFLYVDPLCISALSERVHSLVSGRMVEGNYLQILKVQKHIKENIGQVSVLL